MAKARWEPFLIKNLKLVIPEHYMFMASKNFFIALGILGNYLEKNASYKLTLPPTLLLYLIATWILSSLTKKAT